MSSYQELQVAMRNYAIDQKACGFPARLSDLRDFRYWKNMPMNDAEDTELLRGINGEPHEKPQAEPGISATLSHTMNPGKGNAEPAAPKKEPPSLIPPGPQPAPRHCKDCGKPFFIKYGGSCQCRRGAPAPAPPDARAAQAWKEVADDLANAAARTRRSMMREVDLMAHALALEVATGYIESEATVACEDGVKWMDLGASPAKALDEAVRYLELRGAVVRHPAKENWLRLVQPGALE